jgi:2,4-dienoyl-CoA reductase-like NADH-dependent reductase (Old Yellow Enzyme family)
MEELLESEKCDLIFIGRKLLKNMYFSINAANRTR